VFTARYEPNLYMNINLISFFKGLSKARKFIRTVLKIFISQVKAHEQVLAPDGLIKIREQSVLEELDPEPKEDCVLKSTGCPRLNEARFKVLDDTDCSKQRAGPGQGIMMMLACCEEILKEKNGSLSARL